MLALGFEMDSLVSMFCWAEWFRGCLVCFIGIDDLGCFNELNR